MFIQGKSIQFRNKNLLVLSLVYNNYLNKVIYQLQ